MRLLCALLLPVVGTAVAAAAEPAAAPNVHCRGSLANSRLQFESGKGHVAFLGGSITEMDGFRPMVSDRLKKQFPKCEFAFTNAGIASTCSTTGAFRLATDVLAKGPVDLLFMEFAVNDDQDAGHAKRECIRGLEGIIRHLWEHNPNADVVVAFFVNEGMLADIAAKRTPMVVAAHDAVAAHYQVSSVDLTKEVADRIAAGKLTWKDYGGVHPAKPGNALAAEQIGIALDTGWKDSLQAKVPHKLPAQPLDAGNYGHGRFAALTDAKLGTGWTLEKPMWKQIPGQWRDRFREIPLLMATEPGAELTFQFEGQSVGAYVLAGPDAGKLDASIDGGPVATVELFHKYSSGLHYPRTVMFATDLAAGKHTLTLRLGKDKNPGSKGTAARIVQFAVN